jgi:hypothetical protein
VTDHVIKEHNREDRSWLLRDSWVRTGGSKDPKLMKRFRIALSHAHKGFTTHTMDSPASKPPPTSSHGFTYHSSRGGGLKHTVRSHILLRRRHRERATNSRGGGWIPQSKSPASLHLLTPCHAHPKPENTHLPEARSRSPNSRPGGPDAGTSEMEIYSDPPWALEKPEVSIGKIAADPQRPQANKERTKER